MERSFAGHEAVLRALIAGDDRAAGSAMREHVAGGLSFLDLVAELPPGAVADDDGAELMQPVAPPALVRREVPAEARPRPLQGRRSAAGSPSKRLRAGRSKAELE